MKMEEVMDWVALVLWVVLWGGLSVLILWTGYGMKLY